MGRLFFNIAYNGSSYSGWQLQNNAPSVQGTIEEVLSRLFGRQVSIIGCGRTDTGVHASDYYFHVDLEDKFPLHELKYKANMMVGPSINIKRILNVDNSAHTRFDATRRSYEYHLLLNKDPFRQDLAYVYDQGGNIDINALNEASSIILEYDAFYTFCKTHSDVTNYNCKVFESRWELVSEDEFVYHVSANRFLRGMVRLIVGMCINVAIGKMTQQEVHSALKDQTRLERPWSVPAKGLFLTQVIYPYIE